MNRFKNILYVSEPTVDQYSAIARAAALAESNQAHLTAIDVAPEISAGINLPPGGPVSADLQAAVIEKHKSTLETLIAPHQSKLNIDVDVYVGTAFLEIVRAVLRHDFDLVIKPAEDPRWLPRLLGSDEMHLLRKCPCPVWIMKPSEKPKYDTIVAAVDFDPTRSESTRGGLTREILELSSAMALSDFANLHIVHAWDAPAEGLLKTWGNNPDSIGSVYVESERKRHQGGLDMLNDFLRDYLGREAYQYLNPHLHLERGSAQTVVPQLAKKLGADIVVMGTLGRSGISGLFIGNTAEGILDQLTCSILAIKPPGFETPVRLKG